MGGENVPVAGLYWKWRFWNKNDTSSSSPFCDQRSSQQHTPSNPTIGRRTLFLTNSQISALPEFATGTTMISFAFWTLFALVVVNSAFNVKLQ